MQPPSPKLTVRPGEMLAGKYRVERVIGAGGMGVVVAAVHAQLNERVAIKLLLPDVMDSGEALARFMREAQSAVRIKSENVARVTDMGTLENGAPFMVMEYLSGSDLSQLVESRGPLPVLDALDYTLQACVAIAEAHSLGIVHRDLKPSNLFLTRRPDGAPLVKVLDFGISKMVSEVGISNATDPKLTNTGAVMGSPQYMSPEQVRDARHVDHRTDVWALGMILYELLTGRAAFDATTLTGLLASIIADPPVPIRRLRPDVPPALEAVILQCLAKDPAARPQTVGELAKQLLPYAPPRSRASMDRVVGLTQPSAEPSGFDVTVPFAGGDSGAGVLPGAASTGSSWGGTNRNARSPQVPGAPRASGRGAAIAAAALGVGVALAAATTGGYVFRDRLRGAMHAASSSGPAPTQAGADAIPAPTVTASVAPTPAPTPGPVPASTAPASASAGADADAGVATSADAATKTTPTARTRPSAGAGAHRASPPRDAKDGELSGAIDSRR